MEVPLGTALWAAASFPTDVMLPAGTTASVLFNTTEAPADVTNRVVTATALADEFFTELTLPKKASPFSVDHEPPEAHD